MFNTPEQFAAANKASVDAMLTLANTAWPAPSASPRST
jgi:hypothetical protein